MKKVLNSQEIRIKAEKEGRFFVVSISFFVILAIIYLFRYVAGENYWLSIILLYMPQKFFLYPVVLIFIITIIFRKYLSAGVCIISFLFVILLFMKLQLNVPDFTKPEKDEIKIITYNIRAGTFGAGKVAEFLRKTDAHLIFLQEARETIRGNSPDPIPVIIRELEGWNYIRGGNGDELMILSRFPYVEYEEKKLGNFRKCLIGTIRVAGKEIRLINVHFSTAKKGGSLMRSGIYFPEYLQHTADVRKEQTAALEDILKDEKPTILAGDFNTPPDSLIHRIFGKYLTDCFNSKGTGFGMTFSSWKPEWRIDYIYVSSGFRVKNCRVINTKTSDHLPLEAVVRIDSNFNELLEDWSLTQRGIEIKTETIPAFGDKSPLPQSPHRRILYCHCSAGIPEVFLFRRSYISSSHIWVKVRKLFFLPDFLLHP